MTVPADLADVASVPHGRTARRLEWQHLPAAVRRLVEQRLGSRVVLAESQGAGFTPGFASRLTGEDGSRLFVKAANRTAQRQFADSYAEEARKLRLLPAAIPAPRLLWSHDDDGWVVLGFVCVEGENPRRPWRPADLAVSLDMLEEVADVLDPVPEALGLAPLTEELPGLLTGWRHVRRVRPGLPHLEEAAALAERYADVPDQDRFVHSDVRDDNVLLDRRSGRALLCDWNWPALGPAWLDTVDLLVSAYGDGLDADEILASRRLTSAVDPDHVDAALAQLCGLMMEARDRPVPATSPYLRVHAAWYAEATWSWLCRRRGWR